MNYRISFFRFLFLILIIFIVSCKHEIPYQGTSNPTPTPTPTPTPNPGTSGSTCSPDTTYFANVILPLISSTCSMSGCHDVASHREGVTLTSYSNIRPYVTPGSATASRLYRVITSGYMPPSIHWTTAQVNKLEAWINQGALNNSCSECDTTSYKFSTDISPMMQNNCQGCHNPSSLGGNIDLSTYAGIKAEALNGRLYGSVTFAAGYSAMPKGGTQLQSCQITKIKKWIDAGSLNN